MSNIKCAIEIMKKNNYVKCFAYGLDSMPMLYRLESESIEIMKRLLDALTNDESYIATSKTNPCRSIEFATKSEIKRWLDEKCGDREKKTEMWQNSHLDFEIVKFAKECGYDMKKVGYSDGQIITNLKKKKEKKNQKKKEEKQAIELLEKIL